MILTTAQLQAIKAHIAASPDMNTIPATPDGDVAVAALFNAPAAPSFWAWKTNVREIDIYNEQNDLTGVPVDENFWNWTNFKSQSAVEIAVWSKMFTGGTANFSKTNIRTGVGNIHGNTSANTKHCFAIGRRLTTRCEKLLASGTGTTTTPGFLAVEGNITGLQISDARNS